MSVKPENSLISKKSESKRYHNDRLMLLTLIGASIVTILIYVIPDYLFYEIPTRNVVSFLLTILEIDHSHVPNSQFPTITEELMGGPFPFIEALPQTPGIYIPDSYGVYYIVKACTGMQAGGLLVAIILVTNAPKLNKLRASLVVLTVLFITNALRIAFHLAFIHILVTQFHIDNQTAFYWGHDVLTKAIGFFGTILFALIIEKMGVPIIDQFADWLDWIWWRLSTLYSRFSQ